MLVGMNKSKLQLLSLFLLSLSMISCRSNSEYGNEIESSNYSESKKLISLQKSNFDKLSILCFKKVYNEYGKFYGNSRYADTLSMIEYRYNRLIAYFSKLQKELKETGSIKNVNEFDNELNKFLIGINKISFLDSVVDQSLFNKSKLFQAQGSSVEKIDVLYSYQVILYTIGSKSLLEFFMFKLPPISVLNLDRGYPKNDTLHSIHLED